MSRNLLFVDTKPNVFDERFKDMYDETLELLSRYGQPKLGRWVYCKYCYKNVQPILAFYDGLIECSECKAGLAPLDDVIKAGSYQKWYEKLELDFARYLRYMDEVKQGIRKPTGMDEYGIVPHICEHCKKEDATVYSNRGHLCRACDKNIREDNNNGI